MSAEEENSLYWESFIQGDQQALFALYNDNYFHLVRIGLKTGNSDELVKDCINQLFLQLWDKRARLDSVQNVRAYLSTSLRRLLIDQAAYQTKMDSAITNMVHTDQQSELSYEEILIQAQRDEEMKARLHIAIQKLTPRQTELIQLKFFEGLSYAQIAEHTTQSIKTCYNTVHDAIKTLKKHLL